MSDRGQDRCINDISDVSGVPPMASELARRSNNGPGQSSCEQLQREAFREAGLHCGRTPGKPLPMSPILAHDFASQSFGKAHEVVALPISDRKAIE
jgi:hypothetical protein